MAAVALDARERLSGMRTHRIVSHMMCARGSTMLVEVLGELLLIVCLRCPDLRTREKEDEDTANDKTVIRTAVLRIILP